MMVIVVLNMRKMKKTSMTNLMMTTKMIIQQVMHSLILFKVANLDPYELSVEDRDQKS